MYNVYAFISSIATNNNPDDGGNFRIVRTDTGREVSISELSNVAEAAHKLANKTYSIEKRISDNNMIFSIFDYYRTKYQLNVNGRILSGQEISVLYNKRNEFAEALNVIDGETSINNWKKLLFDEENIFFISDETQAQAYNNSHPNDRRASFINGQFEDAANNNNSKWFSCNDCLSTYANNTKSMPATVIYYDRSQPGSINSNIYTSSNTISAHFRLYYIATPCI